MITDVGLYSHLAACLGFGVLAAVLLRERRQTAGSLWLVAAALATALWAGTVAMSARFGTDFAIWVSPAETVRTAAWIAFLVTLLRPSWSPQERLSSSFVVAVALAIVVTVQIVADVAVGIGVIRGGAAMVQLFLMARLLTAIGGLVLVHNLFVNAAPANRWGIRFLCIALAGFFGFDLNMYTLTFLRGHVSADLFNGRGVVEALVVPLIVLSARRNRLWKLQLSRQIAFQTLSLGVIGGYLVLMSLAAWAVQLVGGDWGRLLRIAVPFGMAILAATVLLSGRFRALARVWINKNFFAYKYDYRQEWLRLIDTVSRDESGYGQLPERVVQSICRIVDSPGGALYTPDGDDAFELSARWNYRAAPPDRIEVPGLHGFLAGRGRVVNLDEMRAGEGDYGGLVMPGFAGPDRRAWLIVPLLHIDRLAGLVLMERSLAERELNWEDFDLLRTAGRQAASYIAEAASQSALSETRTFDEFNRRFAFIMHDIKNLVSQLSLVARNAERHADNPEFRADMVATLNASVGKMNDLLARLAQHNTGRPDETLPVDLRAVVAAAVKDKQRLHTIRLSDPAVAMTVTGDAARLDQLFQHLLQNAIDASAGGAPVEVLLARDQGWARVEIADSGTGMSAAFVREELFRPFRSTKMGGFGIGAYEAREIARAAGGRLDVASREGEGTVFTVLLPAVVAEAERMRA